MSWLPLWLRSTPGLVALSESLSSQGAYAAAESAARAAIRRLQRGRRTDAARLRARALAFLGIACQGLGKPDEAEQAFIEAANGDALPRGHLSWLLQRRLARGDWSAVTQRLGHRFLKEDDGADADATTVECRQSLQKFATRPHASYTRAIALQWLQHASLCSPALAWPKSAAGALLLSASDFGRARALLEQASALDHGDPTRLLLALACLRQGDARSGLNVLDSVELPGCLPSAACLRAHGLRMLGRSREALDQFQLSRELNGLLADDDWLAYGETLAACERWPELVSVFESRGAPQDARWQVLACLAALREGRHTDAWILAARVPAVQLVAHPAIAAALLQAARAAPLAEGILPVLERFPVQARDLLYAVTRGEVCRARNEAAAALDAWSSLPVSVGAPAMAALIAEQAACGREDWLQAAACLHTEHLQHPAIQSAITRSLDRLRTCSAGNQASQQAWQPLLRSLAGVGGPLEVAARVALCLGSISGGRWEEACDITQDLSEISTQPAAVGTMAAACALLAGLPDRARSLMESVPDDAPARAAAQAGLAMQERRWADATKLLRECVPCESLAECLCIAGAGSGLDFETLPWRGLHTLAEKALRACALACAGEVKQAVAIWPPSFEGDDGRWSPLRGWIALQEARERLQAGHLGEARERLAAAVAKWPSVLTEQYAGRPGLLPLLVEQAPRDLACALLYVERAEDTAAAWHAAAIFLLGAAAGAVRRRDWEAAASVLECALAYWAAVFADGDALTRWLDRRQKAWQRLAAGDPLSDLTKRWTRYLDALCTAWAEDCPHTGCAERLRWATVVFRAELDAAQLAASLGGMDRRGRKIAVGPMLVSLHGLDDALQDLLCRLPEPSEDDELLELLQAVGLKDLADSASSRSGHTSDQARLRFSRARIAAVLKESGEIDAAIAYLRRLLAQPLAADGGGQRKGTMLVYASPAYAMPDGREAEQHQIAGQLAEVLATKGETAAAAGPQDVTVAAQAWSEALSLLEEAGPRPARERLSRRIVNCTLGRAKVLREHKRNAQARDLLQRVHMLLPEAGELSSFLANMLVDEAIDAANERSDWKLSLKWMREAQQVAPDLPRVTRNLALCLHQLAGHCFGEAPRESVGHFKEAAEQAMEWLRIDPSDQQMQQVHRESLNGQAAALLKCGDRAGAEAETVLEAMMSVTEEGRRRLSTRYHNEGVEAARLLRWQSAVDLLEKALHYEQDSEVTRRTLAQCLICRAVEMETAGNSRQARGMVERATRLHPEAALVHSLARVANQSRRDR